MEHLKAFLDAVCSNNLYYTYEQVENLAELYRKGDVLPRALIEWDRSMGVFHVKFRIGIGSKDVAEIARDMSEVDSCLRFEEDFIIDQEHGYLYGEDATKMFLQRLNENIEQAQMQNAMDGAIYISHEPIIAAGSDYPGKTKIERLWDSYDE